VTFPAVTFSAPVTFVALLTLAPPAVALVTLVTLASV
jgi:hypothetical protein